MPQNNRAVPMPAAAPATLRFATRADALGIAEMSRDLIEAGLAWSWTRTRILRILRQPDTNAIVAVEDARRIGFGIMKYGEEEAHLILLAVQPAYARRGVGSAMVEWLEASACVAGIARISLEARASNSVGRAFYRSLGYAASQMLPGYYGGRETSVRMVKQLHRERTDAA